jgi:uncharacterized protein with GYD domain
MAKAALDHEQELTMPTYITLAKLTEAGAKNVKEWPKRIQEAMAVSEGLGVRFQVYMTTGEYDFVGIAEAPNDEAIAKANLSIALRGDVRTITTRAFGVEEIARIVDAVR